MPTTSPTDPSAPSVDRPRAAPTRWIAERNGRLLAASGDAAALVARSRSFAARVDRRLRGTSTSTLVPDGWAVQTPDPSRVATSTALRGPGARVLNLVAHPDDDLIFLNPDLLETVRSGSTVMTVYLSSGDAVLGRSYGRAREEGVRRAHALMAGAANSWRRSGDLGVPGSAVHVLRDRPSVSLGFLRLPDGGMDGGLGSPGPARSMAGLWRGDVDDLPVDAGVCHLTRTALVDALAAVLADVGPDELRSLSDEPELSTGDHSDHVMAARLARAARDAWGARVPVRRYVGYPVDGLPVDVHGEAAELQERVIARYAARDPLFTFNEQALGWTRRQYLSVHAG